jgi:CheY-like chemotaxis protein
MLGTTALAGSSALPPLPRIPMSIAADNSERPLVLIVDDDDEIRSALEELLLSVGIDACCFASTQELLHADLPERPGCLILDVRMPGASGLDLQQHLASNGNTRPIIFLTGHGDIAMTVQAMKAGAADFLTKPVRDQTLLDAVTAAIEKDISLRTITGLGDQPNIFYTSDNVFNPSAPYVSNDGVLFSAGGFFFNVYSVANGPTFQYYISTNQFGNDYFTNPLFKPGQPHRRRNDRRRSRTIDLDHDDRGLRGNFSCRLCARGQMASADA